MLKVILPTAGKGTRLRPHTYSKAKSLVKVAGKEVLGHIIDRILQLNPDEIIFIVDENGKQIEEFINSEYNKGIKYTYIEQKEKLGPAHAVSLAGKYFEEKDEVLIVYNDCIYDADIEGVIKNKDKYDGAIWVDVVEDPRRFGIVFLDENDFIRELIEKPDTIDSNLAMVGLYYVKNAKSLFVAINKMMELNLSVKGEYYLPAAFEIMIKENKNLFIAPKVLSWLDCGKIDALLETNKVLLNRNTMSNIGNANIKNSVIIEPVYICNSAKIEDSVIGPYVSVGKNVNINSSVIKDSIVDDEVIINNLILKNSVIGRKAELIGNCIELNIGDDTKIIYK